MQVKSFEDLQVWQEVRVFVNSIYELTGHEKFKKDYSLSQRDGNAKRSNSKSSSFYYE